MPELPEVETVCRALRPRLTGRTIERVEIFSPKMREPLTPLLTAGLEGRRIAGVRRRGRWFLIDLDDGRMLLGHLGMSGVIRLETADTPRRKHEHVFLRLDDGMIFRFECTRRFSLLKVAVPAAPGGMPPELAELGVEPLAAAFTPELFHAAALRRPGPVKSLLMDNRVVVGVGNIYAAESLFRAGISPLRSAATLTLPRCRRLVAAVRKVLAEAIAAGGTTVHDYRQVDGSQGAFVRELRIYGRAGAPCVRCGTPVRTVRIGGRSSCYCPRCQR